MSSDRKTFPPYSLIALGDGSGRGAIASLTDPSALDRTRPVSLSPVVIFVENRLFFMNLDDSRVDMRGAAYEAVFIYCKCAATKQIGLPGR